MKDIERDFDLFCILYICDRDFDTIMELSEEDGVFYTDYYSIESYLISEVFFRHILFKFCNITRKKERERVARTIWDVSKNNATNLMIVFALMCYARRIGISVDLDKHPLSSLSTIAGGDEINVVPEDIRKICARFGIDRIDEVILDKLLERMKNEDFRVWMRGRHCLQYVREISNIIVDDVNVASMFNQYLGANGIREAHASGIEIPRLSEYISSRVREWSNCS